MRLVGGGTGFCNWVSLPGFFGGGSSGVELQVTWVPPPKYPCCPSLLYGVHSLSYTVYTVAQNSVIRCRAKGCQPNRRLGHAMQLVRQVNPSLHVPVSALFTFFLAAVDIDTHEHD